MAGHNKRMKLSTLKQTPFEIIAAVITWFIVASLAVYVVLANNPDSGLTVALTAGLFVLFIVSFIYSTSELLLVSMLYRKIHMAVQICAVFVIYFLLPINFTPILATIWSAQLPRVVSFKQSVIISGLVCIPIVLVFHFYWQSSSGIISALVYWMFNLFGVVTMDRAFKEEQAKEKANQLNRELLATQSLLSEATKQSERLRISRNIHDVVGHHLTALTINLQVASHLSEGKAKESVEQSYSVAKLLLSDVRAAVSEIRDMSIIDLHGALQRLFDNTPKLKVKFNYEADIKITEVSVAEMVLRAVQEALTNALKHGSASGIWIDLSCDSDNALLLLIKSDGCSETVIVPGNGLTGMKERVHALDGSFACVVEPPYFKIAISIPLGPQS